MALTNNIIKNFAGALDTTSEDKKTFYRGLIEIVDGKAYVRLDGSTTRTPVTVGTNVEPGQRVIVAIENHQALVIGNISEQASAGVAGGYIDSLETYTPSITDKLLANSEGENHAVSIREMISLIYPIGSIYISTNSANPATLFGGTWVQIQNRFLLAAGSSYSAGSTGGASSVTLTDAQMAHGHGFTNPKIPNHKHSFTNPKIPNHTHSFTQPKIPNHTHNMGGSIWSDGTGTASAYVMSSNRKTTTRNTTSSGGGGSCTDGAVGNPSSLPSCTNGAVGNPTSLPSCTNGAVSNLSGASSTRTAHNNMPPYLAVYVWERTG